MSRDRVFVLIACLLGAAAVVGLRLFHLQIVSASSWEKERRALSTKEFAVPFRRGAILDRTGAVLAVDVESFSVDFEYGPFRQRNPIGLAAHARSLLEGRLVTLQEAAADPRASATALLSFTPADVAALPLVSSRSDARLAAARLLALDAGALRRFNEDLQSRSARTRPLADLCPDGVPRIAASIERAAASLARLDALLAKPPGTTLQWLQDARLGVIASAETRVAELSESGAVDDDGRSGERARQLRHYEGILKRFADDVPFGAAELIASRPDLFAGFTALESSARRYPYPNAASLVGFVTRPTEDDLNRADRARTRAAELERLLDRDAAQQDELERLRKDLREESYLPREFRGASGPGIEFQFESALRGSRGVRVVSDDSAPSARDRAPEDGQDVTSTLDAALQAAAEKVLRAGMPGLPQIRAAIVVMDPFDGDVLALATSPDVAREDWNDSKKREALIQLDAQKGAHDRPLHHRGFNPYDLSAPGSTFKVITAFAALQLGTIDRDTVFHCPGDAPTVKCEAHGAVNLKTALEASCNVYFARVGELVGADAVRAEAVRFGIGQKTGCFATGRVEQPGLLPKAPSPRDVASVRRFSIGEHGIEVTPLQIARVYAAIANGGRLLQPRLVRAIGGAPVAIAAPVDLGLAPDHLEMIGEGLRQVVVGSRGTANKSGLEALKRMHVVGKTGTPEVDTKRNINNGWFAGYAPADSPRVAFAVYVERVPFHGGEVAAPIANALFALPEMAAYVGDR